MADNTTGNRTIGYASPDQRYWTQAYIKVSGKVPRRHGLLAFATGRQSIPRHNARLHSTPLHSAIPLHDSTSLWGRLYGGAMAEAGVPCYTSARADGVARLLCVCTLRARGLKKSQSAALQAASHQGSRVSYQVIRSEEPEVDHYYGNQNDKGAIAVITDEVLTYDVIGKSSPGFYKSKAVAPGAPSLIKPKTAVLWGSLKAKRRR